MDERVNTPHKNKAVLFIKDDTALVLSLIIPP